MAKGFPMPRDLDTSPGAYIDPPDLPFAPMSVRERVNLEELARQVEVPPLRGVAEAIANLKFHELMEMANAIGPQKATGDTDGPNYALASSLNNWALAQFK